MFALCLTERYMTTNDTKSKNTILLNFRLTEEQKKAIEKLAEKRDVSVSHIVRESLKDIISEESILPEPSNG